MLEKMVGKNQRDEKREKFDDKFSSQKKNHIDILELFDSLDGSNNKLNTVKKRISEQETNVKENIKSNSREKR